MRTFSNAASIVSEVILSLVFALPAFVAGWAWQACGIGFREGRRAARDRLCD